jgi:hypothetical protein
MAQQLIKTAREALIFLLTLSVCLVLVSCSIQLKIPDVVDNRVKELVRSEAAQVVTVSDDRENFSKYQFFLSDFPREDLLGMSVGNRKIYISYKLAARALTQTGYLWLLRQTIAHEIAHETADHANQKVLSWFTGGNFFFGASGQNVGLPWYVRLYNYPTEKELESGRLRVLEETRLGLPDLGAHSRKFSKTTVLGRYLSSYRPPIAAGSGRVRDLTGINRGSKHEIRNSRQSRMAQEGMF